MTARGNYCIPVAEVVWARTPRVFPEKKESRKMRGMLEKPYIRECFSNSRADKYRSTKVYAKLKNVNDVFYRTYTFYRLVFILLFEKLLPLSLYYFTLILNCYFNKKKKNYPRIFETIHDRFTNSSCFSRKATLLLFNINRKDIAYCWKILMLTLTIKSQSVDSWQFQGWKKFKHEHEKWKMEVARKAHHRTVSSRYCEGYLGKP